MVGVISFSLLVLHILTSSVSGDLTCPAGIRSFSNGAHSNSYYLCEQEKSHPVLKTCEPGSFYWAYKQTCHVADNAAKNADGSDLVIYRPSLGATVFLGDLYNSYTDEVLTGYSYWKSETILRNKKRSIAESVSVNVFDIKSRMDALQRTDFSSAMKTDILGGLIPIEGSAGYLTYTLRSEKEVAVSLTYEATTHTQTLPVSTPKDYDFCEDNGPTHVITSVTYGFGANFVFTKIAGNDESQDQLTEDLVKAVNAIKTTKVEISDPIKKIVKDVRVNLFSDFVPEKQPGNYEDTVRVYQSLSSRVGQFPKYANNTRVMKIQLMPITKFCKDKRTLHIFVSENILNSVNRMLSEMEKMKLTISTLKMERTVRNYLPLLNILDTLIDELTSFEFQIKTDLRNVLPRIRRGNSSEEELVLLLNRYSNSPFRHDNLETFLDNRLREVSMLDYILNPTKFEGTDIKVLNYKQGSDIKTMFVRPFVLMLKYNILPSKNIVRKFIKGEKIDESKVWFNNPYVISAMGIQFSSFVKFSSSNKNSKTRGYLLAVADAKDDVHVIDINAQKEGLLYSFTFPEIPPTMSSISTTHTSITFNIQRPSGTWITGFSVSFRQYGHQTEQTTRPYQFLKNVTTIKIEELMANTVYQFSLQYLTPMGASPPSPISYFSTRICSVPTNLRTIIVAADSFKVSWDPPITCGKSVHIRKYKVTVTGRKDFIRTMIVDGSTNVEIKRLEAASEFNVSIQAVADRKASNGTESQAALASLPSTLNIITRPDSPSRLSLVNRSIHSAVVVWEPPKKLASGAILQKYLLKYIITNNLGDVYRRGTEMVVASANSSYHITNLIQGTTYSVSVKVLTSKGDSDYSSSLVMKTMFQKSELDVIRESLNKSVSAIESEIVRRAEEVDGTIKAISNTPQLMVYYPRLRADDYLVQHATGCGGTINAAGSLTYPSFDWCMYHYRAGEICNWDINTGMPTTLQITDWSFSSYDYIKIYDEEKYIGQYTSSATIKTRSGKAHVKFYSNADTSSLACGFKMDISVTNIKRIAAQRYYPTYKATFNAYGAPSSYTEHHTWEMPKTNSSIPLCIKVCNEKHSNDRSWSEVSMELDAEDIQCTCYKNARGFTYALSKFHYRIV